jgi:hypothetical protein
MVLMQILLPSAEAQAVMSPDLSVGFICIVLSSSSKSQKTGCSYNLLLQSAHGI